MFQNRSGNNSKGMTLVELLMVIAIITIGLVYLLTMFSFSLRIAGEERNFSQANLLAQQALEGVRNFRDGTAWQDDGLGTLSLATSYHLAKTGSPLKWDLVLGEKTVNGFTEKIVFDEVQRDADDNIVESGGTVDSETKKVTVTISWQEKGKSRQVILVTFLTNWQQ